MALRCLHPVRSFVLLVLLAFFTRAGHAQAWTVEEQTLANGLACVHIESESFQEVALSMHWQFKPGLELERAGTRDAWVRCIEAHWIADTTGTGWNLDWDISPFGFTITGDEAQWQVWTEAMLRAILEAHPETEWDAVRAAWLEEWDATEGAAPRILERAAAHALFSGRHVYGEVVHAESLHRIASNDLAAFRNDYWLPNNCTLAIATPTGTALADSLMNLLAAWDAREVQKAAMPLPTRPQQLAAAVVVQEDQPLQAVAGHTIRLKPDHADATAMRLLVRHLEGITGARIALRLDATAGRLIADWSEATADLRTSIEALRVGMGSASRTAIEDSTLRALRTSALEVYQAQLQSPTGILTLRYTEPDVFAAAATGQLSEALNSIRANDLQRVAINYLRPNNMHIIAAGAATETSVLLEGWIDADDILYLDQNIQPLSQFGPVPAGVQLEDILAAHYHACGGVEAFEALRSCRQTGTMSAGGGMVMDVETESLFGVGHRSTISVEGQVMMEQLVRPDGGISMQMGKRRAMPESEFLRYEEGLYAAPLLAANERGLKLELVGTWTRGDQTLYVVEALRNAQRVARYFFDASSHYLTQRTEERTGPTGPLVIKTTYENYQPFDGMMFATRIVQRSNNQNMEFTIESVLPHERVDKKQFEWE